MIKVAILSTCLSRRAGGIFATLTSLVRNLHDPDIEICVFGINEQDYEPAQFENAHVELYEVLNFPFLRNYGYSPTLMHKLESFAPDIIHVQGIWMYHSYIAYKYKRIYKNTKIVIQPHGMLDAWALNLSKWKKKILLRLYEEDNIFSADCIHALCEAEKLSIRSFGAKNPISLITNGIELPSIDDASSKIVAGNKRVALFLGRLHPKKGLYEFLQAFSKACRYQPHISETWCVHIAGWDQACYKEKLKGLVTELGLEDNVAFLGPLYGEHKRAALFNSDLFILPSFSEGVPMAVLEAWAYALPVLMTSKCNLSIGFTRGAANYLSLELDEMAEQIIDTLSMSKGDLIKMGKNGRALVEQLFSWHNVAADTAAMYKWLLNEKHKPDFVYV